VLGKRALADLTQDDVVWWRDAKKRQGYASATVNGLLAVLKAVLADAAAQLGRVSPAARVQALPEDDTRITDEEPNSLTAEEARAFLAAARERWPEHYAMIFTLLVTGARMSQVCALRWEDIDEAKGEIRFRRRRFQQEVYAGVKGPTPSARKRVHVVALTLEHAEVLTEHRQRLVQMQHKGLSSGWVFPSEKGACMPGPSSASRSATSGSTWASSSASRRTGCGAPART
jgi:integrase